MLLEKSHELDNPPTKQTLEKRPALVETLKYRSEYYKKLVDCVERLALGNDEKKHRRACLPIELTRTIVSEHMNGKEVPLTDAEVNSAIELGYKLAISKLALAEKQSNQKKKMGPRSGF